MDKKILTKEITKKVVDFIDNEISRAKHNDEKWKDHYNSIMEELNYEIKSTEETILDFEDGKLKFNQVEMEGFLRGLKTMYNRFKNWEEFD